MVTLVSLWLPIILSAVIVFLASFIVWNVLRYHRSDFKGMPGEAALLDAMRRQGLKPGQYYFPYAAERKQMRSPEMLKKFEEGPVGFLAVLPPGAPKVGGKLGFWFLYLLVLSTFVAYLAGRTLSPGTAYLAVFRVAGTAAILGYAGALVPNSIWWGRGWSTTLKEIVDSVVYGLLTAGVFGWLWPR